jgi:hypothetical protein
LCQGKPSGFFDDDALVLRNRPTLRQRPREDDELERSQWSWRMIDSRTVTALGLTALCSVVLSAYTQQQQRPGARAGWPCGGRLDPSYFQIAEGTGGHLMLLGPEEIADSATLLTSVGQHPQTISRIAGAIQPGLQEFSVPIDSSVESVLFSMAVQCLQTAEVVRPSGAPAIGDDVIDFSNFRAQRMVIVRRPEPGTWKMRIAGSGIGGLIAQARSAIGIVKVDFAPRQDASFAPVPRANVENILRIRMEGDPSDVRASLVDGTFQRLANLPLDRADAGTFVSRVTPGVTSFRVLVTGTDAVGRVFQRLTAPLLTPTR